MIVQFLNACSSFNNMLFEGFDNYLEALHLSDWLTDAIIDSVHIIPFLFIIFVLIELVEYFYSAKINSFIRKSEKFAPIVGSVFAVIPQCGFSIIATSLYLKRYLTKGTLIAIYLATSDEAIPILLAQPDKLHYIVPIITLKLFVSIIVGYSIDFLFKDNKYIPIKENIDEEKETGCCNHTVIERHPKELIIHPIKHTLNIFMFILGIMILLNFFINVCMRFSTVYNVVSGMKFYAPLIIAIVGLVPNCTVSVCLTMLLINGSLKFSAVMSGLLSNTGLGILVLLKQRENYEDTIKIISILLLISIVVGYILQITGN